MLPSCCPIWQVLFAEAQQAENINRPGQDEEEGEEEDDGTRRARARPLSRIVRDAHTLATRRGGERC